MYLVMVESPFAPRPRPDESRADALERNLKYARQCLSDSLRRGEAPFASHLLYPQVLDDEHPDEREKGIKCGYAWLEEADLVAFYVDLGWSTGMLRAFKVARIYSKKTEIRSLRADLNQEEAHVPEFDDYRRDDSGNPSL